MAYYLTQLNIAQMRYPLDSPEMAGFVARIDEINALAERAPGFVWRLQGDEGNALSIRLFGDSTLVNMSVWESIEALHDYVYRSAHIDVMRRQKEWFARMAEAHQVMWWAPEGTTPTLLEARQKLALYREQGATAEAFGFKSAFPAPA